MFPGTGSMPLESLLIRKKASWLQWDFPLDIAPNSLDAGSSDREVIENIKITSISNEVLDSFSKYLHSLSFSFRIRELFFNDLYEL